MSAIVKGKIVDTALSRNARGGTEQMRNRLLKYANPELLNKTVIHCSRFRQENWRKDESNILYCHDLANDPESAILANDGWKRFAKIVFVSYWQRDQFILTYGIPYSICTVIQNAIESNPEDLAEVKSDSKINLIYHTTPHRGLELVYPIFNKLAEEFDNIHLDVFSSFEVYGWKERDEQYKSLFEKLKTHPKITYHGAKSNDVVLETLASSHIFLYPCIWQETSCIAMIEAIRNGCICVHPNLGALTETASGVTIMYDYTENKKEHMIRAYNITRKLLTDINNSQYGLINNLVNIDDCQLRQNSIYTFTNNWNKLLEQVVTHG